ncbi:MAG: 5-guanidino-2-oxopentanoate decarboxylase [Gammaproteobacteria bacterium]|nr:5-guanidino-2-oxopentanoate decarboxylase [Gammaproteobacteria bacterium]
MRVGQALVELLQDYGVELVFGIPGTHSLEVYRGLSANGIRHVLPRHEQGAGFMADGYARISGKPGVCFVITGPGVTNIATPLGEAYLDAVPMLVVSPVNPHAAGRKNHGRLHEITDQAAVTRPLTAFSDTALQAADIPRLVARAFAVFAGERPAPVHINIPLPVLQETVTDSWRPVPPPARPAPAPAQLATCAQMLAQSANTVIVAGGGARAAATQVVALAEHLAAPVLATVAGRGIIDASHELCPGGQLRAEPVQALLAHADVALLLGTDLAEPDHWNDALAVPAQQIRVNLDGDALLAGPETIGLRADIGITVDALLEACVPATAAQRTAAGQRCAESRTAIAGARDAKTDLHRHVVRRMLDILPHDAIVVSDMTQIAYTAVDFIPLRHSQQWLHPTGYGTLGYALPAAIGAKLAAPARKVVVLAGDAGFQYTGQEMAVAAELGMDIAVVLWNNDALQQIKDDMLGAQFEPLAVTQRNPDFGTWAQACGWLSGVANDLPNFARQLTDALANEDRCSLIQLNEKALSASQ